MPLDPAHVIQIRSKAAGVVELRSGVRIPPQFRAIYVPRPAAADPSPPWLARDFVEVEVTVVDGEPVVTRLDVRADPSKPVTKATLKALTGNLDQLVDLLVASAMHLLLIEDGGDLDMDVQPALDVMAKFRRRRVDDALLREVADIVRDNPDRPTVAVQTQLYTSHRNATRWIAAAREAEFLKDGVNGD